MSFKQFLDYYSYFCQYLCNYQLNYDIFGSKRVKKEFTLLQIRFNIHVRLYFTPGGDHIKLLITIIVCNYSCYINDKNLLILYFIFQDFVENSRVALEALKKREKIPITGIKRVAPAPTTDNT